MLRGEIYWIDFGNRRSSVQSGRRPGVVIQNDLLSNRISTRLVVPLTSNLGTGRYRGAALVPKTANNGLGQDSVAKAFQTTTMDIVEFGAYLGAVEQPILDAIIVALNVVTSP